MIGNSDYFDTSAVFLSLSIRILIQIIFKHLSLRKKHSISNHSVDSLHTSMQDLNIKALYLFTCFYDLFNDNFNSSEYIVGFGRVIS
jgi:hypothetical protein